MTATSPVSPGRSGQPRLQRIAAKPDGFARSCHWAVRTESDKGRRASALSAIAGALAASLPPDMLTTAKIATLTGVTEVHHG